MAGRQLALQTSGQLSLIFPELAKGAKSPIPGEADMPETAIREKLLDGPNPVDTPMPKAEVATTVVPGAAVPENWG